MFHRFNFLRISQPAMPAMAKIAIMMTSNELLPPESPMDCVVKEIGRAHV